MSICVILLEMSSGDWLGFQSGGGVVVVMISDMGATAVEILCWVLMYDSLFNI